MVKNAKIHTKGGDDGTTALGGGRRVSKDALRVEVYGTLDELNSFIGNALSCGVDAALAEPLEHIQNDLFYLGAGLSTSEQQRTDSEDTRIERRHIDFLERLIDRLSERLEPLRSFILPGGSESASRLHTARAVCRRAERLVVRLRHSEPIPPSVVAYLNRLSDALFVMARYENKRLGIPDSRWNDRG